MSCRIFIAFLCLFTATVLAQSEESQLQNEAPNFELENLDGDWIILNDNLGKGPVLISFWATWCKPCMEELSHIQKIFEKYKEKGLMVYAISTDNEKSVAKVKPLIKSSNYSFPVLLDTGGETARNYFARQVPYSVILDENGKIVYSNTGYKKGDELNVEEIIKSLIEK